MQGTPLNLQAEKSHSHYHNMHDIESESLPAHVSICQQRYHALEVRLNGLENRIEKIEELVMDIHQKIDRLAHSQTKKWDSTQTAIIAGLIGLACFLVGKILF